MAYLAGKLPAGLGDTSARTEGDRPVEARSFNSVSAKSLTFPLVTESRRDLTVTLAARPVFDLRKRGPTGVRLSRTVRRAGGESALAGLHRVRLTESDLKKIDVETLHQGVRLLDLSRGGAGAAPAFWRTIATSRGRFALLYAGLESHVDAGLLLVEIMGIDLKADPEAVRAALDHLQAQRRGVIVNAPPEIGMISRLAPVRPRCLSVDFAGVETGTAAQWGEAALLIAQARTVAPDVLIANLPPARGEAAAEAGATHAVFADMEKLTV